MYADLYGPLGRVNAFAVYLTDQTLVRYIDDSAGIYVSTDGETHVDRIIEVLTDVLEDGE